MGGIRRRRHTWLFPSPYSITPRKKHVVRLGSSLRHSIRDVEDGIYEAKAEFEKELLNCATSASKTLASTDEGMELFTLADESGWAPVDPSARPEVDMHL